jgi:hypothetical protein
MTALFLIIVAGVCLGMIGKVCRRMIRVRRDVAITKAAHQFNPYQRHISRHGHWVAPRFCWTGEERPSRERSVLLIGADGDQAGIRSLRTAGRLSLAT